MAFLSRIMSLRIIHNMIEQKQFQKIKKSKKTATLAATVSDLLLFARAKALLALFWICSFAYLMENLRREQNKQRVRTASMT
jgi:hypothetical protein